MGGLPGPGSWSVRSHQQAVANARAATTELSRRRLEREDAELYLRQLYGDPVALDERVRAPLDSLTG